MSAAWSQDNLPKAFPFTEHPLTLTRPAREGTPFNQAGRRFAVLGDESGRFEAWAYPLKLFRQFEFSFFVDESTRPVNAGSIVRTIDKTPSRTTLTYTFQSFTVKAHYITSVKEPGALILLEVEAVKPLTVVCGFIPVLQPMWPAGLGGQYAFWNRELNAYVISEPTRKNHGIVGSPAASAVSYTPAHMLSDDPNEFRIIISDPETVRGKWIPIVMAGGKGNRETLIEQYRNLQESIPEIIRESEAHYRSLLGSTLQIQTPDERLNQGLEWAKVSYDNLVVENPDLGTGLVAGLAASGSSGRPGFGWFFGGDTYINALSLNSLCHYSTVRQILEFMVPFQRDDGKMAHEISQAAAYIDWFGDYPYAYIHGDTSPFFIVAVHDYVRMSGDLEFAVSLWPVLKKAYDWCLSTDANSDGLMDNSSAGLGALEYGALAGGLATDIYLGAIWTRAARAMADLCEWTKHSDFIPDARRNAERAVQAFRRLFWDPDTGVYAYAFNDRGEHVKEFSPWNAVGLMWELGEPDRSAATLRRIASSELTTDWGVRSISINSSYYQPLNYNYGAVWPFLNSWVASAHFRHHFMHQGFAVLKATMDHVYHHQLGAVGEVFSGSLHTWPQESVSHQGFSTAGTVLPLVRGLLGLDGDAMSRKVVFAPQFRADWDVVTVSNYRIGEGSWEFEWLRSSREIRLDVRTDAVEYELLTAPFLGPGTRIDSVLVNGMKTEFECFKNSRGVQPRIRIRPAGSQQRIQLYITPAVEVLPAVVESRVGDSNRGLKIVWLERENRGIRLVCEGLAGESYHLRVTRSQDILEVRGGRLKGDLIFIDFPEEEEGFVEKEAWIKTRTSESELPIKNRY